MQVERRAHMVGAGISQAAQPPIEQRLEQALGQREVASQVAGQTHRHTLLGGEAGHHLADRQDVVHVLVRVDMAGADAVFEAALPLRLQFRRDGLAGRSRQPQAMARQVQVEFPGGVAQERLGADGRAQRSPVGQVEMQADAPQQALLTGQRAGLDERRHVGHQRRRADQPLLEGVDDGAVLVLAEAKVVGVDDDALDHWPAPGKGSPLTASPLRRCLRHSQTRCARPMRIPDGRQE